MIATTCYTKHVLYHKQTFLTEKKFKRSIFTCKININNKLKNSRIFSKQKFFIFERRKTKTSRDKEILDYFQENWIESNHDLMFLVPLG